MREMASRLKNGEDMDTLEHEFGEQIEQEMAGVGDGGDSESTSGQARQLLDKLRKQPRQDPELYKLEDYL